MNKSQSSAELILVFSIIFVVLIFILTFNSNVMASHKNSEEVAGATGVLDTMETMGQLVFAQGTGSQNKVLMTLPEDISEIQAANRTLTVITSSGQSFHRNMNFGVISYDLSNPHGRKFLYVRSIPRCVVYSFEPLPGTLNESLCPTITDIEMPGGNDTNISYDMTECGMAWAYFRDCGRGICNSGFNCNQTYDFIGNPIGCQCLPPTCETSLAKLGSCGGTCPPEYICRSINVNGTPSCKCELPCDKTFEISGTCDGFCGTGGTCDHVEVAPGAIGPGCVCRVPCGMPALSLFGTCRQGSGCLPGQECFAAVNPMIGCECRKPNCIEAISVWGNCGDSFKQPNCPAGKFCTSVLNWSGGVTNCTCKAPKCQDAWNLTSTCGGRCAAGFICKFNATNPATPCYCSSVGMTGCSDLNYGQYGTCDPGYCIVGTCVQTSPINCACIPEWYG